MFGEPAACNYVEKQFVKLNSKLVQISPPSGVIVKINFNVPHDAIPSFQNLSMNPTLNV